LPASFFFLSIFKDNPFAKTHLHIRFDTDADLICRSSVLLAVLMTSYPLQTTDLEYEFIPRR
jgi:hypothetical protein